MLSPIIELSLDFWICGAVLWFFVFLTTKTLPIQTARNDLKTTIGSR